MNQSKVESPIFWKKWRDSGAVGNMVTSETRPIRKNAKSIVGVGVSYNKDGTPDFSTLSIGERVVNKGVDVEGYPWEVTEPELYVVVPGQPFEPGQKIKAKDLPQGTQTLNQAFGHKS